MGRPRARDRIAALEALPVFPPPHDGEVRWGRRDGTVGVYVGPVIALGDGIPRPRSRNPLFYRMQRFAWHVAFGYVSGFPVRDILAYALREWWPIEDVTDVPTVDPAVVFIPGPDAELTPSAPMTEADYVDLCEFLASGQAIDAGIVEPVRPHWLVPIEPEEE